MGLKRDFFELLIRFCGVLGPRICTYPTEPKSIFVLRNNDLGDLLVVTPLFEALRRRFPRTRIVAGVGDWAAPILLGNPNVDEIISINAPWHNTQAKPQGLVNALKYIALSPEMSRLCSTRHDIGIDVLGSGLGSLLFLRAGIPFRLGVRGYAGGHSAAQDCVNFNPNEHVGRSALRFAELLGATELPSSRPQIYLDSSPTPSGAVVLAPGGGYREKCWPIENYVALAALLSNMPVHVIGGTHDKSFGMRLAQAGAHVTDLTGQLTLRESFEAIAAARAVVCNSSVAMHAAAAFFKPTVVALGAALPDLAQHLAQWGYDDTCMLAEPTPKAVHENLLRLLAS